MNVSPRLSGALNLPRAWKRVWQDRLTDFVGAGVDYPAAKRDPSEVIAGLLADLEAGEYRPSPLRRVDVPKPNHTLRPGAIPVLRDRILYQALVDTVTDTAESKILGPPTVFGFQLNTDTDKEEVFLLPGGYDDFRGRASNEYGAGHRFLLETDIAAYFECVEDRFLQETLLGLGVSGVVVDALVGLINFWSRPIPTGLPQGVWPSDYLGARVYLDRVDKAMQLYGYRYFRYSDDIRIAGDSLVEIRAALRDLVTELRAVGLHVSAAKTYLLQPDQVEASLRRLHERIAHAKREELAELLGIAPYGYTSPEEALRELSEQEILESEPLLDTLLADAHHIPSQPDFELCRMCFAGYRRIKSRNGIEAALDLLSKLPALTSELVRYLLTVLENSDAQEVTERALAALRSEETIYPWQKHWLLRLMGFPRVRTALTDHHIAEVLWIAANRNEHWSVRAWAILLIGIAGDDACRRRLRDLYAEESVPDIRYAILLAVARLPSPERKAFYRLCRGFDSVTDLVIDYLTA